MDSVDDDGTGMGDLLCEIDTVATTSTNSDLDQQSRRDLRSSIQNSVGIEVLTGEVEEAAGRAVDLFPTLTMPSMTMTSINDFFRKLIDVCTECMPSFKILIGFSQIVSVVDLNFSVQWPAIFLSFLSVLAPVNLDIFHSINVDCMATTWTYYSTFQVTVVAPFVVFLLQLIFWWLRSKLEHASSAQEAITTQHIKFWLFFMFLIYPAVSSATLKVWHCLEVEGVKYLAADFRIMCDGADYDLNFMLAFVAFGVYVFGIPASLFLILWINKQHLYEQEGEPEDPIQIRTEARYGFLYSAYDKDTWWWEIALLIHKLCLTGLIIFIKPNTVSQLATGFVVSIFFLVLHVFRHAYVEAADDTLQFTSMLSLTMTLFFGIVIKTDDQQREEDRYGKSVVAFLLVANNVMVIGLFMIQLVVKATCTTSSSSRQKLIYKVMRRSLRLVRPRLTQNIYHICKELGLVEVHDYIKTAGLLMSAVNEKLREYIHVAHANNVKQVFQILITVVSGGEGTTEDDTMESKPEIVDAWWRLVVEILGEETITELVQPAASNAVHLLKQLCQEHAVDMPDCVGQFEISATIFGVVNGPSVCILTLKAFIEDTQQQQGLATALTNLTSSISSVEVALRTTAHILRGLESEYPIMSMVSKDKVNEEWLTLTMKTLHTETLDTVDDAVTNSLEPAWLDPAMLLYELQRLMQMADALDQLVQVWRLYACVLGHERIMEEYEKLAGSVPLGELVVELCGGNDAAQGTSRFQQFAGHPELRSFSSTEGVVSTSLLGIDAESAEIEQEMADSCTDAPVKHTLSADQMAVAKAIFGRYDFDGSGTCNSLQEAQQMTTNMLFTLGYVLNPDEALRHVAAGPLKDAEENPMNFEQYMDYFQQEFPNVEALQ